MDSKRPPIDAKVYLGHILVYAFVLIHPFHYLVQNPMPYYREAFAIGFAVLYIHQLSSSNRPSMHLLPSLTMAAYIAVLGVAWIAIDSRELYNVEAEAVIDIAAVSNPEMYVVRNALLYLPLCALASVLRWDEKTIRLLCRLASTLSVASVLGYLLAKGVIFSPSEIVGVIRYGASGLSYNSYVPYLTFAYISGLYWFATERSTALRVVPGAICLLLALYSSASGSRQCTIFIFLTTAIWTFIGPKRAKARPAFLLSLFSLGFLIVLTLVDPNTLENERFASRFLSIESFLDTTRSSKAIEGLAMLQSGEFLHGAGLGSVLFAGPHNDYVRWIQRAGILSMILGFIPYFWALFKALQRCTGTQRTPEALFLLTASLFTPYHSCFGYPRDDAFQAPYVLLALGICASISSKEASGITRMVSPASRVAQPHQCTTQPIL